MFFLNLLICLCGNDALAVPFGRLPILCIEDSDPDIRPNFAHDDNSREQQENDINQAKERAFKKLREKALDHRNEFTVISDCSKLPPDGLKVDIEMIFHDFDRMRITKPTQHFELFFYYDLSMLVTRGDEELARSSFPKKNPRKARIECNTEGKKLDQVLPARLIMMFEEVVNVITRASQTYGNYASPVAYTKSKHPNMPTSISEDITRHAIVVGVNAYGSVREDELHFSANDALSVADYMLESGVPARNISLLCNLSPLQISAIRARLSRPLENFGSDEDCIAICDEELRKSNIVRTSCKRYTDTNIRLPTRENILDSIYTLRAKANKTSKVYFYYSGHGDLDGSASPIFRSFLRVADSSISGTDTRFTLGIESTYLRRELELVPAFQRVLILDACHSGGVMDTLMLAKSSTMPRPNISSPIPLSNRRISDGKVTELSNSTNYLGRCKSLDNIFVNPSGASMVLASSGYDESSYEDPINRHGVFTFQLLNILRSSLVDEDRDSHITLCEMENNIYNSVEQRISELRAAGHLRRRTVDPQSPDQSEPFQRPRIDPLLKRTLIVSKKMADGKFVIF
jgi:hypothetical protein